MEQIPFDGISVSKSIDDRLEHIRRIEHALGFSLYEDQIKYTLGEILTPNYDPYRRTGKTTAYCIKLSLSDGPALDIRKPHTFSDAMYSGLDMVDGRRYSKSFFLPYFLRIRDRLSYHGFRVRDIYPHHI